MASAALSSSSSYSTTAVAAADDSFATYLSLVSQSLFADLAPSPACPPNPPTSRRSSLSFTHKITNDDSGELDVFSAEKYFSGTLDHHPTKIPQNSPHNNISDKMLSCNSEIMTATTTCNNSRTVLLSSKSSRCGRRRRRCGRNIFRHVFRCVCLMSKNDVDHHQDGEGQRWKRRSESSTELFEIESLSGNSSSVVPAGAGINSYAPSEASIEWSVVTLSAANVSSSTVGGSDGEKRRSSASGMLMMGMGCVSDKGVDVVREGGGGVEVVGSLERYRAMMDLESANVAGAAAMGTSRSRRVSI